MPSRKLLYLLVCSCSRCRFLKVRMIGRLLTKSHVCQSQIRFDCSRKVLWTPRTSKNHINIFDCDWLILHIPYDWKEDLQASYFYHVTQTRHSERKSIKNNCSKWEDAKWWGKITTYCQALRLFFFTFVHSSRAKFEQFPVRTVLDQYCGSTF